MPPFYRIATTIAWSATWRTVNNGEESYITCVLDARRVKQILCRCAKNPINYLTILIQKWLCCHLTIDVCHLPYDNWHLTLVVSQTSSEADLTRVQPVTSNCDLMIVTPFLSTYRDVVCVSCPLLELPWWENDFFLWVSISLNGARSSHFCVYVAITLTFKISKIIQS